MSRTSDIQLIIFDCDGVLVDSEPLAMRVLRQTLKSIGYPLSEDQAYRDFLGRSLATVREALKAEGIALGDDALDSMRDDLFALYRTDLTATHGLKQALSALAPQQRICVASSSQPERIRISLELTGLLSFFEGRCFSATQVERGKPAPDLFLYAARKCGVAPENCLVIEDSPAGIAAAKAAGMRVFAFAGNSHISAANLLPAIEAAKPDLIFDDMRALPALVASARIRAQGAAREPVVIGVDVGTASVRAGLFTQSGTLLARTETPITVTRRGSRHGEYASSEIWSACCDTVRRVLTMAEINPEQVKGLGFDATCSLVVLGLSGEPLDISDHPDHKTDTLAWFDHRAFDEAHEVTATSHEVLDFCGGVMSPEMEIPKLIWLKRNRPDLWQKIGYLFDLADYLTWRATGTLARSQSTLTAKWTYLGHKENGWQSDFFERIGLTDLFDKARLPQKASAIGANLGMLTKNAAQDLGLTTNCHIATGMIDAHAGALGILGRFANDQGALNTNLGLIAGTSSCVVTITDGQTHIKGSWGPYFGAVLPDKWLTEAGQSATGALLDHIISSHASGGTPDQSHHQRIIARIIQLRKLEGDRFGNRLHVVPDFHGNRSPLAAPDALGVVSGLSLDPSFDGLCKLYWRTCVGIAMGLRHILDGLGDAGQNISKLHLTGGHTRNPLLMELYADVTGCAVVTQGYDDAVLLGCAMSAGAASGLYDDLTAACIGMSGSTTELLPNPTRKPIYDRDYEIYLRLQSERQALEVLICGPLA